jgi:CheY-like chemotaxis protein
MAIMLGDLGVETRVAPSVDEAIEVLASFVPDVILSDLAMPDRDGYDLVREVRRMPKPLSKVPAIAMTAYARADDAERALRAGFTRHLPKPTDAEALAGAIRDVIRVDDRLPSGAAHRP